MKTDDMNIERARKMIHNAVIALKRGNSPTATAEERALMEKIMSDENTAAYFEFLDELADMDLESKDTKK